MAPSSTASDSSSSTSKLTKENPPNASPPGSFKFTSGKADPSRKTTDVHAKLSEPSSLSDFKFTLNNSESTSPEKSQTQKEVAPRPFLTKHNKYYFFDGSLEFVVASCAFKVHRHLFANVKPRLFSDSHDTLRLPTIFPSADRILKKTSEPIRLDNFPLNDMESLLWALYESQFAEVPDDPVATWSSVLLTSYKWGLSRIFSRAVKELEPLSFPDPAYKIQLARTCQLSTTWALNAFEGLIRREDNLTLEEGKKIGLEGVILITTQREQMIRNTGFTLVTSELANFLLKEQPSPPRTTLQILPARTE